MNIKIREGTGNYFFRGRFIVEPSHVNIENLSFGRMAFHGMNPDIEKMAEDERVRMEEAEEARREKDVQDDEMAEFFSSVNSTVAKKFATKRSHEGQKMTPRQHHLEHPHKMLAMKYCKRPKISFSQCARQLRLLKKMAAVEKNENL